MCKQAVDRSQGQVVDLTFINFASYELLLYIAERLKRLDISYCFGEFYDGWTEVGVSHIGGNTIYMWLYMMEYPLSPKEPLWREGILENLLTTCDLPLFHRCCCQQPSPAPAASSSFSCSAAAPSIGCRPPLPVPTASPISSSQVATMPEPIFLPVPTSPEQPISPEP
ncbi:hypothetical protein LXL04_000070 [Taraxacum kok-saghyz]